MTDRRAPELWRIDDSGRRIWLFSTAQQWSVRTCPHGWTDCPVCAEHGHLFRTIARRPA